MFLPSTYVCQIIISVEQWGCICQVMSCVAVHPPGLLIPLKAGHPPWQYTPGQTPPSAGHCRVTCTQSYECILGYAQMLTIRSHNPSTWACYSISKARIKGQSLLKVRIIVEWMSHLLQITKMSTYLKWFCWYVFWGWSCCWLTCLLVCFISRKDRHNIQG